jgi:hypothetical protein
MSGHDADRRAELREQWQALIAEPCGADKAAAAGWCEGTREWLLQHIAHLKTNLSHGDNETTALAGRAEEWAAALRAPEHLRTPRRDDPCCPIVFAKHALTMLDGLAAWCQPGAGNGESAETPEGAAAPGVKPRPKRSTKRGDGRTKLIAALTKHHQYADGSCLNLEPVGNNELAKAAGVSASTASAFFNDKFHGHTKYMALCLDLSRLVAALKLLNDEFAPYELYGRRPPDEGGRDDE